MEKRTLLPRPEAQEGRQEAEKEQVEAGHKGTSTCFHDDLLKAGSATGRNPAGSPWGAA